MANKPRVLKIKSVLEHNRRLLDRVEFQDKPYGGSNPYYYCPKCERSVIEISYLGHYSGCKKSEIEAKVKSLQKMYEVEKQKFIEAEEYNSKRFQNFVWFKKGLYVIGLTELIEEINKNIKNKL